MAARIALHRGAGLVIGVDLVPDRLERASRYGATCLDLRRFGENLGDAVRDLTGGRGTDAVIDAVGMEAHGSPVAKAHTAVGLLPDALAQRMMETAGIDRLAALHAAIDLVRRGGTISVSGVYGGSADPMPLLTLFDKQIQLPCSPTTTRWAWTPSPPTTCRWKRARRLTRRSRRRPTA